MAAGASYWSEQPRQKALAILGRGKSLSVLLTPAELALLGAIGDGADNATAAGLLDVSEHTVATMRRNLHHKLKLRHKGDVVRFAMENGFVRFSRGFLSRPGFAHLRAAYHARRPRAKQGAKAADSRAA